MRARPIFALLFGSLFFQGCEGPPGVTPAAPVDAVIRPEPVREPVSRWNVHSETSELDGKKKVYITDGEVIVRCLPKVEGYIRPPLTNLGHRLETDAEYTQLVRYKFDDGPVRGQRWAVSDSFDSLFMPRAVVQQLGRAKKLTLEYEPEYVTRQVATIELNGLAEAEAQAGCKF